MKVLNAKNMAKSRQQGFTIIELIVVILLLGILTATALPRFLDVTDNAHTAVVDAVEGGLATGAALFRAAWIAGGEDTTAATGEFGAGTLFGNSDGYPIGLNSSLAAGDCKEIYDNLLQGGAPVVSAGAAVTADPVTGQVTAVSSDGGEEFVSFYNSTDTACHYVYVGQFKQTGDGAVPMIKIDLNDGTMTRSTVTL